MMFKLNDDAGLLIQLYSGIKAGETQLPVAKGLLESMFPAESAASSLQDSTKPPSSSFAGNDLLDIFSSPAPQPAQSSAPFPPSHSIAPPPAQQQAPRAIALAPPPPTPSRVLPSSLRQPAQATPAPAVDIFGDVLMPQQAPPQPAAAAPLSQPAVDIFGDPIKPSSSFPDADPFAAKVSIDDILGQPTPVSAPPVAAAAPQTYPQYSPYPAAGMMAAPPQPSHPYDPFAPQVSQAPPLAGYPLYAAPAPAPPPYQSSAPLLDPFDSFSGLSAAAPYQQPPPSHTTPPAAPPPAAQSNNPFDLF
jgi:hypothetical protein